MEAPRGVEPTGTNGRTRHTFRPACRVGSRPVVVSFVGWQGMLFLVVTETIPVKRFCSRPLSGSRTATIGIVAWFRFCRPILVVGRYIGFAVVMAQVRRPVPFRTRKLRPGRGDGTALESVWESSTPLHSTSGFPSSFGSGNPHFFMLCCAGQPAGARCLGFPSGLSRCSASGLFHAPGDLERRGISGISGEPLALIRWLNRLKNYALFRTQTLCRIEQNHVSRQSNSPAGRRPKLA